MASRRQCTPHTEPPAKEVRDARQPLHSHDQSPNGGPFRTRSACHHFVKGGREALPGHHPSRPGTRQPQAATARDCEAWRRRIGRQLASDGAGGSGDVAAKHAPEARTCKTSRAWPGFRNACPADVVVSGGDVATCGGGGGGGGGSGRGVVRRTQRPVSAAVPGYANAWMYARSARSLALCPLTLFHPSHQTSAPCPPLSVLRALCLCLPSACTHTHNTCMHTHTHTHTHTHACMHAHTHMYVCSSCAGCV